MEYTHGYEHAQTLNLKMEEKIVWELEQRVKNAWLKSVIQVRICFIVLLSLHVFEPSL